MPTFRDQVFDAYLPVVPEGYDGSTFERCRAQSVTVGTLSEALRSGRPTLRRLTLTRCTANAMSVGPLILEDCTFDRLRTSRAALECYGTAFVRCTFRGSCGRLWLQDASKQAGSSRRGVDTIASHNQELHSGCAFALDIREATFSGFDARGIEGRHILINHTDQFLFDRAASAAFLESPPKDLPEGPRNLLWSHVAVHPFDFVVHVSPTTRAKRALQDFADLVALAREHGLLIDDTQ